MAYEARLSFIRHGEELVETRQKEAMTDRGGKGMRFWREKKGVSVVLGTLLIFTIMVGLYASIQTTQVPIWNSQIDVQAYETTYGDMLFLKSDVKNVALLKQPKSTTIRMGARYPDRMVFINPKQGIYGIMDREDTTVTIQYTVTWSTGSATYTENHTSSRLIYESMGAARTKIIYEHGLIIREFPAGSASTDPQELIVDEELSIPVLDASLMSPKSSMRSESFSIKPYAGSQSKQNVTSVTITLPTNYPRIWAERLEGLETDRMTISANETTNQVIITSTAIRRISFPVNPATDSTLSAGVISMSTTTQAGFDPTTDFPSIRNVLVTAVGSGNAKKTNTEITATVYNVTAPFDIHADLSQLTGDLLDYDEAPTSIVTGGYSVEDDSWDVPNE
ncbi:MAG: hypothetical protein HYY80_01050, partial [Chloroflexi bacterium]|nr:hypothetical protein [Chloroflexota bacterium]